MTYLHWCIRSPLLHQIATNHDKCEQIPSMAYEHCRHNLYLEYSNSLRPSSSISFDSEKSKLVQFNWIKRGKEAKTLTIRSSSVSCMLNHFLFWVRCWASFVTFGCFGDSNINLTVSALSCACISRVSSLLAHFNIFDIEARFTPIDWLRSHRNLANPSAPSSNETNEMWDLSMASICENSKLSKYFLFHSRRNPSIINNLNAFIAALENDTIKQLFECIKYLLHHNTRF